MLAHIMKQQYKPVLGTVIEAGYDVYNVCDVSTRPQQRSWLMTLQCFSKPDSSYCQISVLLFLHFFLIVISFPLEQ